MTDKRLFSIKDTKAQYYYPPQIYRNRGEAIRALTNSVNDPQHGLFNKNAEDFSLFEIGSWDEITGSVTVKDKEHVVDLVDLTKTE